MRCEYGVCIVCDKEIVKKCDSCGNPSIKTGDYTEVMIPWSNGSRMSMAVCTGCAPTAIWKADKMELTKAVWAAWDKLGHKYDKEIVIVD